MKKIFLLLLLSCPLFCFAQTDTTTIQKPHEQYCMILATAKVFSSKVTITVDYGQETKFWHYTDSRIKDDQGKVVSFNSVIDALNYMSTKGWIFVNAYALSEGSSGKVLNYVMRRPIENQ
ncbi:hypothetical protein [Mucilaginibacter lappiensis]|uniref:hypothetical protein n=1 Tax=Mucilaginibacter lappiensis TaxID=354630 RepID=UPI003D1CECC1